MTQATSTNLPMFRNRFQAFLVAALLLNALFFTPKAVDANRTPMGPLARSNRQW